MTPDEKLSFIRTTCVSILVATLFFLPVLLIAHITPVLNLALAACAAVALAVSFAAGRDS